MSPGRVSWIFLLHLLLSLCAYKSVAREISGKHLNEMNKVEFHDHAVDIRAIMFFTVNDLKEGKRMPVNFPLEDDAVAPKFLAREVADTIPFSLEKLPYLYELFSISPNSPQGKAIEDTLRTCADKPIKGEVKVCATSLETMLDFARSVFGPNTDFKAVTTVHLTKSKTVFQNYTFLEEPKEIPAPTMVGCHIMSYPYAIFGCHSQDTETKVFKVLVGGDNGDRVDAMAVCHMDTSGWNPGHISFRLLGFKPGTAPVCHFFPSDNLVFVPVSAAA